MAPLVTVTFFRHTPVHYKFPCESLLVIKNDIKGQEHFMAMIVFSFSILVRLASTHRERVNTFRTMLPDEPPRNPHEL
jgi:hypothetical protein